MHCRTWSFAIALMLVTFYAAAGEPRLLFDGVSTNGWVLRGGHARFRIEDGCLVGTTVTGQPNSFLCPPGEYGDFVLEFEYLVAPKLNSGVQIRSQCFDRPVEVEHKGKKIVVPAGRVHGYQVEIDNDPHRARFWSAGLYEEGCRGWIFPGFAGGDGAAFTEQGRRLTKVDDWNRVRIECHGDSIRTWLNGELRVEARDARVAKGFIGFQVHSHKEPGLEVRWRNIRIRELP
ncbi:MAG: DUF1080 domain-containing protein [Kiritimatiellae bacterium]|nr:DUF1080 domain-containing protein [Kiritimatiellia bacterium]